MGKTWGRLQEDFGKTSGRLEEDFGKTSGILKEEIQIFVYLMKSVLELLIHNLHLFGSDKALRSVAGQFNVSLRWSLSSLSILCHTIGA